MGPTAPNNDIKIWDLPTRLCYSMAIFIFSAALLCWLLLSIDLSPALSTMLRHWHKDLSWAFMAVMMFRIIWGFSGSYYVRFRQFIKGPAAIRSCLRGQQHVFGHNALNGLWIVAFLVCSSLQLLSGIFSSTGFLCMGNFAAHVPGVLQAPLQDFRAVNAALLIGLAGIHFGSLIYAELYKQNRLLRQILFGLVEFSNRCGYAAIHVSDDARLLAKALLIGVLCAASVIWLSQLGG